MTETSSAIKSLLLIGLITIITYILRSYLNRNIKDIVDINNIKTDETIVTIEEYNPS